MTAGATQRIERALNVAIAREDDKIQRRLTFLATVWNRFSAFCRAFWHGSGALKNAFEEIAIQQNTNLADSRARHC